MVPTTDEVMEIEGSVVSTGGVDDTNWKG